MSIDLEKKKVQSQDEANQKKKIIEKEFEILLDKLRAANKVEMKAIGEKDEVLKQIRGGKDKLAELKHQLAEATDHYGDTEMSRVKLLDQQATLRRRLTVDQPVQEASTLIQKMEKELGQKEREV